MYRLFGEHSIFNQYRPYIFVSVGLYVLTLIALRYWRIKQDRIIRRTTVRREERLRDDDFEETAYEVMSALPELPHVPYEGPGHTLEGGAKQFYKILNCRRSVRHFSTKPVDKEIIRNIIRCAGTAPSGAHTEPWTFVTVTSPEVKKTIRAIVEAEEAINYEKRMSSQWRADLKPLQTNWVKEYLTDAYCLVLVFRQTKGVKNDGNKKLHYYSEISVAIATGFMLAAVQAAGLSSLITTPLNCGSQLRDLLGRPLTEQLLVLAPIGYPKEDCKVPALSRKSLEDIIVEI